ncbi:ABC transporter permease [Ectobacillus sp. JY-23]|uniref:ABC transporter permease n=1 Tax=Ectobacillus sp. JY-23 TaxID=2933872 RepID=UPI001FF233B1|nr:ABC transporter permease [Ectobacillus sp. JY-23]UOY91247.1 ABC transporter permease [Ectobacillus sp. JY-23]
MVHYLIRRVISMLFTLLVIVTLTFILMHSVPGSPFNEDSGKATNEAIMANLNARYHLDEPLYMQFFYYLSSLAQGDLGISMKQSDTSVNELLARGFPVSAELGTYAVLLAVLTGVSLGVLAALRHNGVIDYLAMTLAVIGISVPSFIMATFLIQQIAVNWGILPVATWTSWKHMILPTLSLATGPTAIIARLTRSSMLEVLTQEYIQTAQAKGLHPVRIVVVHALKNAMLPVVTVLGTLVASILTGSFVIEKIFAIPGMGKYFVESINNRDYSVIMGTTVFYSILLIVMLLLVDLVYSLLDPRIKLHQQK